MYDFAVHIHASAPTRIDLAGQLLRLARQIRDLLRLRDVPGEEDDAAEIELARQHPHVVRDRMTVEPHDRELTDMTADIPQ